MWGVPKGSSMWWVVKFKGKEISECKLSNGWSRSYREIKLLLSAGKWVVAKLQGDKSASQSSMELYDPWISGPSRIPEHGFLFLSWNPENIFRVQRQSCTLWRSCSVSPTCNAPVLSMTRRRFQRTTEVIPRRPWKSKNHFASRPIKIGINTGTVKGAREVQSGTSSIHFHKIILVLEMLLWERDRAFNNDVAGMGSGSLQHPHIHQHTASTRNIPSMLFCPTFHAKFSGP